MSTKYKVILIILLVAFATKFALASETSQNLNNRVNTVLGSVISIFTPSKDKNAIEVPFWNKKGTPEQEKWLDKLGEMENCPSTGMIDSNHKLSYSRYCYQEDTFVYFVKRYNLLPQSEDQEILNWISDDNFQRYLTLRIISEDPKNALHWRTTVEKRKLGLPKKIPAI